MKKTINSCVRETAVKNSRAESEILPAEASFDTLDD